MPSILLRLLLPLLLLFGALAPAHAAVEVAFYSREAYGDRFPHAFVRLTGTVDATGEPVDLAIGFTAKAITPAILLGSVAGDLVIEEPELIARSDRQFAVTVSDAQYGAVLAVIERYRRASYNLNRRNCVHFVGEIAAAIGLNAPVVRGLMKKPRSFLQHIRSLNSQFLTAR